MLRKVKVYGWHGHRRESPPARNGSQQTREIVAVTSKKAAARVGGEEDPRRLPNLTDTENDEEIKVAMAEPGIVFWHPLDESGPRHRWRRAGELQDRDVQEEWDCLPSRLKAALRTVDEDGRWRASEYAMDAFRFGLIECREPPKQHVTEIGAALVEIAREHWEAGKDD